MKTNQCPFMLTFPNEIPKSGTRFEPVISPVGEEILELVRVKEVSVVQEASREALEDGGVRIKQLIRVQGGQRLLSSWQRRRFDSQGYNQDSYEVGCCESVGRGL